MDNENLTNENTPNSASANNDTQAEETQNQNLDEIKAEEPQAADTNAEANAEEVKSEDTAEAKEEPVSEPVAEEKPADVKAEETPAEEPKAEETATETKTEDTKPEETKTEEPVAEEKPAEEKADGTVTEEKTEEEKKKETANRFKKYAAVYEELAEKNKTKERIEVEVNDRIRGGLRVIYKNVPLFLPASHFSLKRNPSEQELSEAVGKKLTVEVHEIQEYDEGRKAVIVSRKNQLIDDFWSNLQVGDIVEGKVSSIASFGVFLDLGGIEGLIHISRLSHVHVDDPAKFVKKGDVLKAKVVELDKEKNRIALNHKELEPSPWENVEEEFPAGSVHKGVVKRITDFGAYVELKPGVDGLLRTQEISWTKRVKHPSDVLEPNQEIDVKVLSSSSEKKSIALSYKQTTENPWPTMHEKYPIGSEFEGTVFQVIPQGIIVTINNELDGFMPRSKMKKVLQGNKIPYQSGETIKVNIVDLVPEDESLILAPVVNEEEIRARRKKKSPKGDSSKKIQDGGISLGDMIPEDTKKGLIDSL